MRKYLSLKNIIIAIMLVVLIIISFLINNKIEPKTSMESINENNYQVKSNNSENNI